MATEIKFNSITVLFASRRMKYAEMIQLALNQNASSVAALSDISYDDNDMHTMAHELQTEVTKYKSKPPLATKAEVDIKVSTLVDAYDTNAGEIQVIARKEAKAAGDVNVGISIVQNAGYRMKRPKSAVENTFSALSDGPRAVKVKTKAVAPRAVYIRQLGMVSGKEVVPTVDDKLYWLISTENDIRADNLITGAWYAFREATIQPISRKSTGSSAETNLEKKITPATVNKVHRRNFNIEAEPIYNFGPWIWVLVQ